MADKSEDYRSEEAARLHRINKKLDTVTVSHYASLWLSLSLLLFKYFIFES